MVSMLDIIQLSSGSASSSGVQHVTRKYLGLQRKMMFDHGQQWCSKNL
jgi:hypothetical protein